MTKHLLNIIVFGPVSLEIMTPQIAIFGVPPGGLALPYVQFGIPDRHPKNHAPQRLDLEREVRHRVRNRRGRDEGPPPGARGHGDDTAGAVEAAARPPHRRLLLPHRFERDAPGDLLQRRARNNRLRSCVCRGKAKLRGIGRARKIIMLENYVIRGIPEFASGVRIYNAKRMIIW